MELKEKCMTANVPHCETPNEKHPETHKVMSYLVCLQYLGFFAVLGKKEQLLF